MTDNSSHNAARGIPGWLGAKAGQVRSLGGQLASSTTVRPESWADYLAYTGTVTLALLALQCLTGLLLALDYEPYPLRAFASLLAIRNDAANGLLISNMHAVGSKLILFLLFVHMFRIMLVSAHRGPRAPQWYAGAALLFLMLFTGFSGYLLPWSQQSYWACVVGTESLRVFPLIGGAVTWLLRGGPDVSGPTLTRFYWLHITLLPLSILCLTWLHVKWVWKTRVAGPAGAWAVADLEKCIGCGKCGKICTFEAVSMAENPEDKKTPVFDASRCNACRTCLDACPSSCITLESPGGPVRFEPLFPENTARRALAVCITLLVYFGIAFFGSGFHKIPADPMLTPDRIKPDWYFLAPYQLLKVLPSETWGLLTLMALGLVVVFLPVLDKSGPRGLGQRPVYAALVFGGIAGFVLFTLWGWFS